MTVAFSVDLEPNKDGSLDEIVDVMRWFDELVPRGTVFVTHRIASTLPDIVDELAASHEIGVHVHPKEFGHDRDRLAELSRERQRELISKTVEAIESATDVPVSSFRAGRHSASLETLSVVHELGFTLDASVNVNYDEYLPADLLSRTHPHELRDGLVEIPTSFVKPPLLSGPGLRAFPGGILTATAATLRRDSVWCSGERAVRTVFDNQDPVSMYIHPYDASTYHPELEGAGPEFRQRLERVLPDTEDSFVTLRDLISVAR